MRRFSSYLSVRQQYVQFKGKLSVQSEIITGVPEGCILGPIFFIVFTNDKRHATEPTRTEHSVDMYAADDVTISATIVRSIGHTLNNDL